MFYRYYDTNKGWDNDRPGWHLVEVDHRLRPKPTRGLSSARESHIQVVEWLYDNIDSCEKHCRWTILYDVTKVRFRYEKDALWFSMRWS